MAYRGGVANVHSDSFLLVLILAWGAVVLLVFLGAAGFAVFRRLRGASIGPVLSGILAQVLGIRLVFLLCAVLAWVLAGAGRWLLSVRTQQPLAA